jgi:hypothetical protein
MFKKWYSRTTPFVLLALSGAIVLLYEVIVERGGPEGWRYPLLTKLFGYLVVIVLIDIALKIFIRMRTYVIWLIELLLLLIAFYGWVISE